MTFTPNPLPTVESASPGQRRQMPTGMASAVTLRDGSEIRIRHVTPEDQPVLLAFMQQLSPESRRLRFFSPACDLLKAARWAASADGTDHIGIVALDASGRILAHAACVRMHGPRAEVAVEVGETHRHQGVATILIARLAREAEQKQIRSFVAEVLPDNHEMLAVFSDGFDASRQFADGEVDIEFPTASWQLPPDRFEPARPATHL
jgi:L-amino acid N-acyltransferase YncA